MKLKRCNLHYEKIGDKVTCIEEEIPFEIPDSWEWSRVGSISSLIQYGLSNSAKSEGNYHLLRITDIQDNAVNWDAVPYTQVSDNEIESFELKNDDILFARTGATVGKSFLVRATSVKSVFASYLIRIQTIEYIAARYLKLFFESGYYWRQITDKSVGIGQPNVNGTSLKNLLLPIPPYNSQVQISNSIDNFLVYADRIESEKADLDSIITQAKSKILDLAIRGKLVPQNPDDEPASILLERIRAEKEELIKQGKIKRDKNESYIFRGDDKSYYQNKAGKRICVNNTAPFEIPIQWEWCQLGELCDYGNCSNIDTASLPDDAWILDLEDIEKDTGRVIQRVSAADRKSSSTKHGFHKGQLLYSKLRPYLNKVLIAAEHGFCTSEILPLEFANIVFPPYARDVLMSSYFLSYANKCSYGVKMPRLGTHDGKQAWIPLPPLAEQHRIATAIDTAFAQLDTIADALT